MVLLMSEREPSQVREHGSYNAAAVVAWKESVSMTALFVTVGIMFAADDPFQQHGKLRVSTSKTHLEHADGTPFFFLADTCWTGPALSKTAAEWQTYLDDRKAKRFSAVQFNMLSPWRTAPTDADGNTSYRIVDGQLIPNETFYRRLDQRIKAINDAGLLAVPVLCWANSRLDPGKTLTEAQIADVVRFQFRRYEKMNALWILAGDTGYRQDAELWKRVGRAVFGTKPDALVTTHPDGENFPWTSDRWVDETWLNVWGYQSGHGDSDKTLRWLTNGPVAEYGRRGQYSRPVINLEPPYEAHNGYASGKPHPPLHVRRAVYWSLLNAPPAGVTYGGHGVWSWHTKPGEHPTGHHGTGPAPHWREGLKHPGSAQMTQVRNLFESLPWTELRPAPELVHDQPGVADPKKFVASAATLDRKTTVFYFPPETVQALVPNLGPNDSFFWFDPRTGQRQTDIGFRPEPKEDWVLVMQRR